MSGPDSYPEDDIVQNIICRNCEAEYSIMLEDNMLQVSAQYCSFCGEVMVAA